MQRLVLIPAAGAGSRLGTPLPKVLVPVAGRPMIEHLIDLYSPVADRFVLVVAAPAAAPVSDAVARLGAPFEVAVQERPTGMLDAIQLARPQVEAARPRRVLITWCDQIAMTRQTIERLVAEARSEPEPALVLPTCRSRSPYVHLQRGADGRIVGVLHRREGDEMPPEGESDAGVFDLSLTAYLEWLPEYAADPHIGELTGERNFVPFVARAAGRGRVATVPCAVPEEAIGINTPEELQRIEAHLLERRLR